MTAHVPEVVKTVLLDAGGVLLLPDPASILPAFDHAVMRPPGVAILDRAHYAGTRALDDDSDHRWTSYLGGYIAACDVPVPARDRVRGQLGALMTAHIWTRPVPGAADAIRALNAASVAVAVVSNAEGTVESMLADAGVCQVGAGPAPTVRAVYDSHVMGFSKPDRRIFESALAAFDADPTQTLFVGDTLRDDVEGAVASGICAIHFDPYRDCPRPDGHAHVHRLGDLRSLWQHVCTAW